MASAQGLQSWVSMMVSTAAQRRGCLEDAEETAFENPLVGFLFGSWFGQTVLKNFIRQLDTWSLIGICGIKELLLIYFKKMEFFDDVLK